MDFPFDFIEQTRSVFAGEAEALLDSLLTVSPVSIRYNPVKSIISAKPGQSPVPWSSSGVYLEKRPSFTFDPLFHGGVLLCTGSFFNVSGASFKDYFES